MLYTLAQVHTYQEEIRKSRYLAIASAIAGPDDALRFFAERGIPAATHNCWAYRVGDSYRFHDDGEPGGTAGRPILQAIDAQQCDRVAVLVVRWFGGIKLGTGGLIRAYGGVAAQCLRLAPRIPLVDEAVLHLRCPFADVARARARLAAFGARIEAEEFDGQGAAWRVAVARGQADALIALFTDLTSGRGEARAKD